MKSFFLFILSMASFAALSQNVSGLYAGTLINDSTHKEQQYEIALSEYRDQITGYAYTTFVFRDTFYYSVKRIKAKKESGALLVEDVKMLANNFPQAPDKGVRQLMRIPLHAQDSVRELKGSWKTTQTKVFYSIGGSLQLKRENDSSQSALVRHLQELAVAQQTAQPAQTAKVINASVSVSTTAPAILAYNNRKQNEILSLPATSDSLTLSFYDNGVVDGDTISVYLNKQPIIKTTKLTAAAAKQVVYLPKGVPVYKLMLVAENLGTIPPNTGLLVIQDGNRRYQVHFTADLQTNAVITFQRPQDQ